MTFFFEKKQQVCEVIKGDLVVNCHAYRLILSIYCKETCRHLAGLAFKVLHIPQGQRRLIEEG